MRILYVTPYFFPAYGYGGTPRAVYHLALALSKRGHKITVLTTNNLDSQKRISPRMQKVDSLRVYYFPNLLRPLQGYLKFPITPQIYQTTKGLNKFELIHLHEYRTWQNLFIARAARKKSIPYALTAHGSLQSHDQFPLPKAIFDNLAGKRLIKEAKVLCALTPNEKKEFIALGAHPSQIQSVANGIKIIPVPPGRKQEFRERFRLKKDPYIIFLGRLHPIKGLDLLVRIFAQTHERINQLKLVLAGPEEKGYAADLKKLLRQKNLLQSTVFTGLLSEKLKWAALAGAQALIYPSRYEAFPLTPLEAISQNVPVLVSDRCGIAPLFAQKKLGVVIAYDHVNDWVDKLVEISENPQKFKNTTRHAYHYLRDNLTWENIAAQHEKIYAQIISS